MRWLCCLVAVTLCCSPKSGSRGASVSSRDLRRPSAAHLGSDTNHLPAVHVGAALPVVITKS